MLETLSEKTKIAWREFFEILSQLSGVYKKTAGVALLIVFMPSSYVYQEHAL